MIPPSQQTVVIMTALKSVEETAQTLGVAKATLDGWRVKGMGPQFVRLGRRVAYRPEDIEAFINGGLRKSTSQEVA
jgi:predicted DNA-binding transcriptional regulator AlpA